MSPVIPPHPVAIVTGAARGIGRACANALAEAGFRLVLTDLDPVAEPPGEALAIQADVADLSTHPALVDATLARWGRLDCLVNNAGVPALRRGDLLEVTPESYDRCQRVNARAVFFLTQTVARHLLAQGEVGGQHRSIVNITSSNAVAAAASRGEYCASKAGASMITRLFAIRLAQAGIGVYEIRPGIIETEMTRPVKALYDPLIDAGGLVPARRWGKPGDVAAAVRCLAEGRVPFTAGLAVPVDGGLTNLHY
jgi:NAD(P)-dependent dehydrogenase (short-subunit alcohol dehydrogenase family)